MKNQGRFIMIVCMVVVMVFALSVSGCTPTGDNSSVDSAVPTEPAESQEILEKGELDDPSIRILTSYTIWDGFKERFATNYDGTVEEVIVPLDQYMQKLSSMVLASDSPDGLVYHSDFVAHFIGYLKKGLLDTFDEYIDLEEPIYERMIDTINSSLWNGKHYFIGHQNNIVEMTVYNTKMFEQIGLETPWELYQKDEWTWDAMTEAAELLAQDTDNDEKTDIYGCTIWAPEVLVGTTGNTFGDIVNENDIEMNLKNDDVVRALQYAYNFNYKNKFALYIPTSWAPALQRDRLAMALVPSWTYQTAEVKAVGKAGNLGMAPLPRDPENDEHISRAAAVGWLLPKDSQNPEGIVAFNKCMIYENYYNEERYEQSQQEMKDVFFFSDENIEQYLAIKDQKFVVDWGKGLAHNHLWEFWTQEDPWTTYVEKIIPLIENEIDQIIE